MAEKSLRRCPWPGDDSLMIKYHDEEWGVPVHEDRKLFEFITLDAFQAGLSWRTILYKREGFRRAFADFNPKEIARFPEKRIEQLRQDKNIVRNRLKIKATIQNAQQFLKIQQEFGSFDNYIWQFTDRKVIQNNRPAEETPKATSEMSDNMSLDLKSRGFSFVGSTICYAFMQAAGIINDHNSDCFRFNDLK